MKKSEIQEMTNEELFTAFYWNAIHITHEENSKRGITKQTKKEEDWILDELIKRFDLDAESFRSKIIK